MKKQFLTTALTFMLTACVSNVTAIPVTQPAPLVSTEKAVVPLNAHPFPQHVKYVTNTILPNHRTQDELDNDAREFYDYWKSEYLVDEFPLYRVAFGKSADAHATTVSEGQGYGMVIVPLMAGYDPEAQVIFDGLWKFVKAHPSEVDPRLMDWIVPDLEGNYSAFDGDADIAFGLLLADAQWGSTGRVNYKAEAEKMIAGILESTIGAESHLPMLGDWVKAGDRQYNQYAPRSSDFMLVNFRAFSKATKDPVWEEVVLQSQNVMMGIQSDYSPDTGLLPDFIVSNQPAPPYFLENSTDGAYYYNAGRIPWRIGLDALLYDDATSRSIAQMISNWIEASAENDPANIRAGYELNGTPVPNSDYFTTFFVAPMGVAAMNNPSQQDWLNAIYNLVYDTHEDYYEDTVVLLCLLVMTGNFWVP